MQYQFDLADDSQDTAPDVLVQHYLKLTKDILPAKARENRGAWPVSEDHCFQRIILDHVCGGVWYEHLKRPAYKHMGKAQAVDAVRLAESILSGDADLALLNKQSLRWRGKDR